MTQNYDDSGLYVISPQSLDRSRIQNSRDRKKIFIVHFLRQLSREKLKAINWESRHKEGCNGIQQEEHKQTFWAHITFSTIVNGVHC